MAKQVGVLEVTLDIVHKKTGARNINFTYQSGGPHRLRKYYYRITPEGERLEIASRSRQGKKWAVNPDGNFRSGLHRQLIDEAVTAANKAKWEREAENANKPASSES